MARRRRRQSFTPTQTAQPKAGLGSTHGQTYSPSPAPTTPKAGISSASPTLPPDPAFAAAQVSNNRNLQIANADYAYGVGQLRQQYGLEDFSNPFSQAALLRESYLRQQRGTMNQFAASGQGYHGSTSGAYQRAQSENTRNYAIADDAMRREYADRMRGMIRGMLGANADYGTNITQADWERLFRQFGGGR